jgi:hypothetical protein
MKIMIKVAIFIAALLLVANSAFAPPLPCDDSICYEIFATDENSNTNTDYWNVCLHNDGNGTLRSGNTGNIDELYLFGGGSGWFNASGYPGFVNGNPNWSTWIARGENESGFLQPIGDGWMLTGEGVRNGIRHTISGQKTVCRCTIECTGEQASYNEGDYMLIQCYVNGGNYTPTIDGILPSGASTSIDTNRASIGGTIDGFSSGIYTNTITAGVVGNGGCTKDLNYIVNNLLPP